MNINIKKSINKDTQKKIGILKDQNMNIVQNTQTMSKIINKITQLPMLKNNHLLTEHQAKVTEKVREMRRNNTGSKGKKALDIKSMKRTQVCHQLDISLNISLDLHLIFLLLLILSNQFHSL